ncbi:MAG TPA: hypothetical protein VH062_21005 [Polyangiaceae bacterium]|nr:hypothetical protein [Polyangiaceae bacterium]
MAGIRSASDKLAASANTVVSAGLQAQDTVSVSDAARQAASGGGAPASITNALVDLRVARYQSAASIAVLRTGDEMTNDLLTLGKR